MNMRFDARHFSRSRLRHTWRSARLVSARNTNRSAFTIVEVVMATAIVAVVFGGIINAYIQAGKRAEWTGYSLAAQSMAQQYIEMARAAVWDPAQIPPVNQITNLNLQGMTYVSSNLTWTGYQTNVLDVPYDSTNYILATNYVTISQISLSTNIQAEVFRVDTVWPFGHWQLGTQYYTNTVCTIISPDNRDPSTF
jgi:type II secretory pathway pseudopilin PulG